MQLPKDKERLTEVLEELETFKTTQGYRLYREKFSILMEMAATQCQESDYPLVYRSQGEYRALKRVRNIVEDLTKEIQQALTSMRESSQ